MQPAAPLSAAQPETRDAAHRAAWREHDLRARGGVRLGDAALGGALHGVERGAHRCLRRLLRTPGAAGAALGSGASGPEVWGTAAGAGFSRPRPPPRSRSRGRPASRRRTSPVFPAGRLRRVRGTRQFGSGEGAAEGVSRATSGRLESAVSPGLGAAAGAAVAVGRSTARAWAEDRRGRRFSGDRLRRRRAGPRRPRRRPTIAGEPRPAPRPRPGAAADRRRAALGAAWPAGGSDRAYARGVTGT